LKEDNPALKDAKGEKYIYLNIICILKGNWIFVKIYFSSHLNNVCFENYDRLLDFHSFLPILDFNESKNYSVKRGEKVKILFSSTKFVLFVLNDYSVFLISTFCSV